MTAKFTSAAAQTPIGAKDHVTSGDDVSSLTHVMIWITVAKQMLITLVSRGSRRAGAMDLQAAKEKQTKDAQLLIQADSKILDIWHWKRKNDQVHYQMGGHSAEEKFLIINI